MGFALGELAQFRESDRAVAIHPGDAAPRPRRLAADGAAYLMSQRRGAPQRQSICSRCGPASTRAKPVSLLCSGFGGWLRLRPSKVKLGDEEAKHRSHADARAVHSASHRGDRGFQVIEPTWNPGRFRAECCPDWTGMLSGFAWNGCPASTGIRKLRLTEVQNK